MSLDINQIALH
ncbi:nucleoid-associated protein NdpA, partial [Salmonella enterica subsp. enterica serovar Infantis]